MNNNRYALLREILTRRVLLLDGAMGSLIQKVGLKEEDFRGEMFVNHPMPLKGNNDVLVLTCPDVIKAIHRQYLEAGSDIIETNSFNATSVSQADYGLESEVYAINKAAATIAREMADEFSTPDKPRFVAGSMGPTNKTASMSPDVNNPGYRAITFDQLAEAYGEQVRGLLDGGADIILIETVFDTLNAKAALYAVNRELENRGIEKFPVMISATVADKSGRILSGQTVEALLYSVSHIELLSVGLNCSFGAHDMMPYIDELGKKSPYLVSAYPNAGMPNQFGEYDQTPDKMAQQIKDFLEGGLVNILGGCCGTTPGHIRAMAQIIDTAHIHKPATTDHTMHLSGLDALTVSKAQRQFYNVGERTNVSGSRKFARLISEGKYDEALDIARLEVEQGADIIDVNMDDAMLDAEKEMVTFLNLMAAEPEVARLPVMIDSSKWQVIEAGLKCLQGKAIVNSISLKEGEEIFLSHARTIKRYGAAVVVMAFDEKGQADTYERRIEICSRAYKLLTEQAGFEPADIIFDPNVLAIATGIDAHNNYGVDFIRTCRWIKENLPHAKISGGVSNLSFAFRGNNPVREAMHCVFLHHAVREGMDMGIVNPATLMDYDSIPAELRERIEDVVLNRRPDATERLVDYAETARSQAMGKNSTVDMSWRNASVEQRLQHALQKGITEYLETDLSEALSIYPLAIDIIEKPLMDGMNMVGELFSEGKMFLPQVVKTARVMKRAVEILRPTIEEEKRKSGKENTTAGKVLMATVKGDVHDIGKNIVSVVMACNNFEVIDLGVMVETDTIVNAAIQHKVDAIGLSGLITPSLEEMIKVVQALKAKGVKVPVMIGGATTSEIHTAVKIAPEYDGHVAWVKDASQNAYVATALINGDKQYINNLKARQETLRQDNSQRRKDDNISDIVATTSTPTDSNEAHVVPRHIGRTVLRDINIADVAPFVNWRMYLTAWRMTGDFTGLDKISTVEEGDTWLANYKGDNKEKAREAIKTLLDGKAMLQRIIEEKLTSLNAVVELTPANSNGDDIIIYTDDNRNKERARLHFERQANTDSYSQTSSLADRMPKEGTKGYMGFFAATAEASRRHLEDSYDDICLGLVADRLAEALSEWLHYKVRTDLWGYSPDEPLDPTNIIKGHYNGIRPAIGYPSVPNHEQKKTLFDITDATVNTGIELTETLAMKPGASVCGYYLI